MRASNTILAVGLLAGLLPSDDAGLLSMPASAILVRKLLPVNGVLGSAALTGLAVTVGDEEVRYLGEDDDDCGCIVSVSSKPASICAPA